MGGFLFLLLCGGLAAAAQEPAPPRSDAELRRLAAAAARWRKADTLIVLDYEVVRVVPSGLAHTEHRRVVRLGSRRAARNWTRLRFDYDPRTSRVEVKGVRVLRRDGRVESLPPDTVLDLPQPERRIYWGARMKVVPLPRLEPGDLLEVRTYRKGFQIAYLGQEEERYVPPMRGHFYDVVRFWAPHPVYRRHYVVTTPPDKPLQFGVFNGPVQALVTHDAKGHRYAFWLERLPPWRREPHAPRPADLCPKVVLATVPDWRTKSRWFARVNEPQFPADPGIQQKVAELLEGKEDDAERVAAILHWVADEIRYVGLSMGPGEGYTVHPSRMTFRDRCGVCKDKAGLAVTMLREAGYTAYAAMTMAGGRVEPIPADQFNHCVVALRLDEKIKVRPDPALGVFTPDGRYWLLDPTWAVFSPELWSAAESEQDVLIGTPAGETLVRTPLRAPALSRIRIEGTSALKPDGVIEGSFQVTGTGYADQRLRRYLVDHPAASWRARLALWVSRLAAGGELLAAEVDYDRLRDVTRPVRYTLRYRLPGAWVAGGKRLRFVAPLSRHPLRDPALVPYWGAADAPARTQPLFLWATRRVEVRERIALPAGYRVERLPAAVRRENRTALLTAEWRQEGEGLVFALVVESRLRTVPVELYPAFREVSRAVAALGRKEIVLVK